MSAPTRAELYVPAGTAAASGYDLEITPETAGWTGSSLRTLTLGAGERREVVTGDEEMIVVPLSGGVTVGDGTTEYVLAGRTDVFDGPTDVVYLPIGTTATLRADEGQARVALPAPAPRSRCPSATCRPPTSPSSCAAPGSAAARCTTSAPPGSSRPTP